MVLLADISPSTTTYKENWKILEGRSRNYRFTKSFLRLERSANRVVYVFDHFVIL